MESNIQQLVLTEDYGKEIFNAAIKLAVDRYNEGALLSEADFFAGVIFILTTLSATEDIPRYLVGPTINIMTGRRIIPNQFPEKDRKTISSHLDEQNLCAMHANTIKKELQHILDATKKLGYADIVYIARSVSKELLNLLSLEEGDDDYYDD